MDIGKERKIALLKKMVLIRVFEEKDEELNDRKLVHGFIHLAIGQEAGTGIVASLLNVGAVGRAPQRDTHLVGHGDE